VCGEDDGISVRATIAEISGVLKSLSLQTICADAVVSAALTTPISSLAERNRRTTVSPTH
jgi:hypothetical protein